MYLDTGFKKSLQKRKEKKSLFDFPKYFERQII